MKTKEQIQNRIEALELAHDITAGITNSRPKLYERGYIKALEWVLDTNQED